MTPYYHDDRDDTSTIDTKRTPPEKGKMRQLLNDCEVYGTARAVALEIYLHSNRYGEAVLKCDTIRQAIRNGRGQPVNEKTIRRNIQKLEAASVLTKRYVTGKICMLKLNIPESKMSGLESKMSGLDAKMSGPNKGSLNEPAVLASSAKTLHTQDAAREPFGRQHHDHRRTLLDEPNPLPVEAIRWSVNGKPSVPAFIEDDEIPY